MEKKVKEKVRHFELTTAKVLSDWWGYEFHRTPASGGLHWGAGNNVTGDIVTPVEAEFPFVVECKKREEWTIENVLLNNKDIKNWWKQVIGDALQVDKIPMLIFSRNRAPSFIMTPYDKFVYESLVASQLPVMRTVVTFKDTQKNEHGYDVIVFTMEGLRTFSPQVMKTKWKSWKKTYTAFGVHSDSLSTEELEDSITDMLKQADK